MVELSFCLQGNGGVTVSGNEVELVTDRCYLHLMNHFEAIFDYDKEKPMHSVAFGIPLDRFAYCMEQADGQKQITLADNVGLYDVRILVGKRNGTGKRRFVPRLDSGVRLLFGSAHRDVSVYVSHITALLGLRNHDLHGVAQYLSQTKGDSQRIPVTHSFAD